MHFQTAGKWLRYFYISHLLISFCVFPPPLLFMGSEIRAALLSRGRGRESERGGGGKTRQRAERRQRERRKTVAVSLTYMSPAQLLPDEMPEGSNTLLHFAKHLDIHKL